MDPKILKKLEILNGEGMEFRISTDAIRQAVDRGSRFSRGTLPTASRAEHIAFWHGDDEFFSG